MTDKRFHKGIEALKKITLTRAERRMILKNIIGEEKIPSTSWYYSLSLVFKGWFLQNRFAYALASILLVILVGKGMAFAAEDALPGDLLYPVKTGIQERLQGISLETDEEKAQWEVQKAERRLEEAEELAAEGKLDASKRKAIEKRFEAHTSALLSITEDLQKDVSPEKAVDVLVDFAAKINAHSRVLETIKAYSGGGFQGDELRALGYTAKEKAQRNRDENQAVDEKLFKEKEATVRTLIEDGRNNLKNIDGSSEDSAVKENLILDTKKSLEDAEQSLNQAQYIHDLGDTSGAYSSLLDGEQSAKEAVILLRQGLKFGR